MLRLTVVAVVALGTEPAWASDTTSSEGMVSIVLTADQLPPTRTRCSFNDPITGDSHALEWDPLTSSRTSRRVTIHAGRKYSFACHSGRFSSSLSKERNRQERWLTDGREQLQVNRSDKEPVVYLSCPAGATDCRVPAKLVLSVGSGVPGQQGTEECWYGLPRGGNSNVSDTAPQKADWRSGVERRCNRDSVRAEITVKEKEKEGARDKRKKEELEKRIEELQKALESVDQSLPRCLDKQLAIHGGVNGTVCLTINVVKPSSSTRVIESIATAAAGGVPVDLGPSTTERSLESDLTTAADSLLGLAATVVIEEARITGMEHVRQRMVGSLCSLSQRGDRLLPATCTLLQQATLDELFADASLLVRSLQLDIAQLALRPMRVDGSERTAKTAELAAVAAGLVLATLVPRAATDESTEILRTIATFAKDVIREEAEQSLALICGGNAHSVLDSLDLNSYKGGAAEELVTGTMVKQCLGGVDDLGVSALNERPSQQVLLRAAIMQAANGKPDDTSADKIADALAYMILKRPTRSDLLATDKAGMKSGCKPADWLERALVVTAHCLTSDDCNGRTITALISDPRPIAVASSCALDDASSVDQIEDFVSDAIRLARPLPDDDIPERASIAAELAFDAAIWSECTRLLRSGVSRVPLVEQICAGRATSADVLTAAEEWADARNSTQDNHLQAIRLGSGKPPRGFATATQQELEDLRATAKKKREEAVKAVEDAETEVSDAKQALDDAMDKLEEAKTSVTDAKARLANEKAKTNARADVASGTVQQPSAAGQGAATNMGLDQATRNLNDATAKKEKAQNAVATQKIKLAKAKTRKSEAEAARKSVKREWGYFDTTASPENQTRALRHLQSKESRDPTNLGSPSSPPRTDGRGAVVMVCSPGQGSTCKTEEEFAEAMREFIDKYEDAEQPLKRLLRRHPTTLRQPSIVRAQETIKVVLANASPGAQQDEAERDLVARGALQVEAGRLAYSRGGEQLWPNRAKAAKGRRRLLIKRIKQLDEKQYGDRGYVVRDAYIAALLGDVNHVADLLNVELGRTPTSELSADEQRVLMLELGKLSVQSVLEGDLPLASQGFLAMMRLEGEQGEQLARVAQLALALGKVAYDWSDLDSLNSAAREARISAYQEQIHQFVRSQRSRDVMRGKAVFSFGGTLAAEANLRFAGEVDGENRASKGPRPNFTPVVPFGVGLDFISKRGDALHLFVSPLDLTAYGGAFLGQDEGMNASRRLQRAQRVSGFAGYAFRGSRVPLVIGAHASWRPYFGVRTVLAVRQPPPPIPSATFEENVPAWAIGVRAGFYVPFLNAPIGR